MELVLSANDIRTLKENGTLDAILESCTAPMECSCAKAEKAEEKPKKKRTTKKKEEPKEEVKEEVKEDVKEEQNWEQTITHDDIVNAAMPLVKAGKQEELARLLATYGVEAIPHLTEEQLTQFAVDLREMGAEI